MTSTTLIRSSVCRQLLEECKAMAAYAFSAGSRVPESLVSRLERAEALLSLGSDGADAGSEKSHFEGDTKSLGVSSAGSKISESRTKAGKRAAKDSSGIPQTGAAQSLVTAGSGPADRASGKTVGGDPAEILTHVHSRLAEIVTPATPRTILLLAKEEERASPFRFLGAVPLIRRLLVVSMLSMCGFVWVSLSEDVNGNGFDLLNNSGFSLLLSEMFLLFAASIGVSFANLFEAQRYIKEGTFDPKFESSYWVRHVLGLMAGTILALLVPIEALGAEQESSIIQQLGKPMLALLGGFSASAVHRILSRIVAALETLVKGDTRDLMAAQERVSKARSAERESQGRLELSSQLIHLEQKIADSTDPQEAMRSLRELQRNLIRGEEPDFTIEAN